MRAPVRWQVAAWRKEARPLPNAVSFPHVHLGRAHRAAAAKFRRRGFSSHRLGAGPRLVDVADVEERLLGEVVGAAVADLVEALERVGELDVASLFPRELLGDVERLAEEALELAGAADDQLVLFAQLVDAEDRDDVLEVAVALEHR